jgi:glycosyltransferase involved in cell wall biosynthesis
LHQARLSDFRKGFNIVSIILPFKNEEKYLIECFESILAQSFPNWELIAIDDHSNDFGKSIVQNYAQQDSRIRYVLNPGQGIIPALQAGLSHASGNLIHRMDADDIMPSNKLEFLTEALTVDVDVTVGQVKYFSSGELGNGYKQYEKWLNGLVSNGDYFSEIYKECPIPSACWMMRRKTLESIDGFDDLQYPEDYHLAFKMYQHKLKVKGVQEVLHFWRDHEQRSSRVDPNYKDNRFLELKTSQFLRIDHRDTQKLVLWGAGKKGKEIAKILESEKIDFDWWTNNERKVGKTIYKTTLQAIKIDTLNTRDQIILAVAGKEQLEIRNLISPWKDELRIFYFC